MSQGNKLGVVFSSKSDNWATPQAFFDRLNAEFCFEIDAAADQTNHKVETWFGPGGLYHDALDVEWPVTTIWLNPPYSRVKEFMEKAAREAQRGSTVVSLIPSRTDTRFWHTYVWDESIHACRPGVSIRFVKGRLKFLTVGLPEIRQSFRNKHTLTLNNGAPFPSCVVIMRQSAVSSKKDTPPE